MRTIMARSPHDASFSFSRRHFNWLLGSSKSITDLEDLDTIFPFPQSTSTLHSNDPNPNPNSTTTTTDQAPKPTQKRTAISRLRSVFDRRHKTGWSSLGSRVTGTLFGHRRGHVRFAIQSSPRAAPALIIELATPTSSLVKEMASGLVRIALECEKKDNNSGTNTKLSEELVWRAYCNGRKCGYAVRKEVGEEDWKVLRAVEPVSMGAGVIPGGSNGEEEEKSNGDVMYMRARFERVVGSKDSEAFYMMNPDRNSGPELSVYFLRV